MKKGLLVLLSLLLIASFYLQMSDIDVVVSNIITVVEKEEVEQSVEVKKEEVVVESPKKDNALVIEKVEEKKEVKKEESVVQVPQVVVIPGIGEGTDGVEQESINKLNTQLNRLPSNIRNRFVEAGWHIYVTNEDLNQKYYGGKYNFVEGVTDYNNKVIYIANTDKSIRESVIHEMGHFIDSYRDYDSLSESFELIYNEEVELFKSGITNSSCVRNEMEFFAESIYYFYGDSSKVTPMMKSYIESFIYSF